MKRKKIKNKTDNPYLLTTRDLLTKCLFINDLINFIFSLEQTYMSNTNFSSVSIRKMSFLLKCIARAYVFIGGPRYTIISNGIMCTYRYITHSMYILYSIPNAVLGFFYFYFENETNFMFFQLGICFNTLGSRCEKRILTPHSTNKGTQII